MVKKQEVLSLEAHDALLASNKLLVLAKTKRMEAHEVAKLFINGVKLRLT